MLCIEACNQEQRRCDWRPASATGWPLPSVNYRSPLDESVVSGNGSIRRGSENHG